MISTPRQHRREYGRRIVMDNQVLILAVAWYMVFVCSTSLHEAAHAFVAWKLGDKTAYYGGQVTLNPAPHIRREPFGMVIVPILSYLLSGWMVGWASCPYDPVWALRYPRRSAMMSLAGPGANLILVLLAAVIIRLGLALGWFYAPESIGLTNVTEAASGGLWPSVAIVLSILFTLNMLLFVFNLIPLPPLDGSGALPLFLDESAARRYLEFLSQPAFSIIGLLVAWGLFGYIFRPIHTLALNLLYPGAGYQ